jgi:hypothetical protein
MSLVKELLEKYGDSSWYHNRYRRTKSVKQGDDEKISNAAKNHSISKNDAETYYKSNDNKLQRSLDLADNINSRYKEKAISNLKRRLNIKN